MRTPMLAALVALALLSPSSASAFFVGARLGYGMPSGDLERGAPMKTFTTSNTPVQVEVGFDFLDVLSLGAYGAFGPTQFKSDCRGCSGATIRGGLQLNLRPPVVLKSLWGGVFAGVERQTLEAGQFSADYTGVDFGVQGGWDFSIVPLFSVGPYASYSIAQFNTSGGDATLGDVAKHHWFTVGLRGLFDL
jgi:hypothetical protein